MTIKSIEDDYFVPGECIVVNSDEEIEQIDIDNFNIDDIDIDLTDSILTDEDLVLLPEEGIGDDWPTDYSNEKSNQYRKENPIEMAFIQMMVDHGVNQDKIIDKYGIDERVLEPIIRNKKPCKEILCNYMVTLCNEDDDGYANIICPTRELLFYAIGQHTRRVRQTEKIVWIDNKGQRHRLPHNEYNINQRYYGYGNSLNDERIKKLIVHPHEDIDVRKTISGIISKNELICKNIKIAVDLGITSTKLAKVLGCSYKTIERILKRY